MASPLITSSTGKRQPGQRSLFDVGLSKKSKATLAARTEDNEHLPNVPPAPISDLSQMEEDAPDPIESVQDISTYALKTALSSQERHKVLCGLNKPDPNFTFPVKQYGGQNRSFQIEWLNRYEWISYSKEQDAAFCKFCVAFATENTGKGNHQRLGTLGTTGYTNWKDAHENFRNHQNSEYHVNASYFSQQFLTVFLEERRSIAQELQSRLAKEIETNHCVMSSILETIILCGRQNIPLRGHIDSGRISRIAPDFNEGNFRSLLRFRMAAGDQILENHLARAPSNAMYTSAPIQNELIEQCGSVILTKVVKRVNDAKCFSVLADETTDISTVEQLTICARYVYAPDGNASATVREDFLKFVPVKDLTGEGLADSILQTLDAIGVDLNYLRGQSYDGASAMSSNLKGVQGRILRKYPKALYTYCANHCLNLVVTDACDVSPIRNMLGVVKEVNNFFSRSALRKAELQRFINDNRTDDSRVKGLIKLCETRWVERHNAVLRFLDLFEVTLEAMESIGDKTNDADTRSKSYCLQKSMLSFDTIVSLYTATLLLGLTLPLSKALQAKDSDLLLCYEQVMEITAVIRRIRTDSNSEFGAIFQKANALANKLDVPVNVPRTCKRQTKRANYNSTDPESYFRQSVFVPFVDAFLASITTRFEDHSSNVCDLLNILPRYVKDTNVTDFENVVKFYQSDLSCSLGTFEGEYRVWKRKWSNVAPNSFPASIIETVSACNSQFFPNISKLVKILCTLPITTATPERCFSTLRRLKTYLRNTMSEDRLNGLTLLNVHMDVNVSAEEVLKEFKKVNRRIKL